MTVMLLLDMNLDVLLSVGFFDERVEEGFDPQLTLGADDGGAQRLAALIQ